MLVTIYTYISECQVLFHSVPFRDVPPQKKVKTGWDEGRDDMKVKGGKGRSKERKGRLRLDGMKVRMI